MELSEIEHVIVVGTLFIIFVLSFGKRKGTPIIDKYVLGRDYSAALKGIACVFILIGHYETINYDASLSSDYSIGRFIQSTSANIGLVWFMFISGYGLSVSKKSTPLRSQCFNRLSKIFLPMLFVFFITLVACFLIPTDIITTTKVQHSLYTSINDIKNLPLAVSSLVCLIITSIEWYWYVWCITIYYIVFYLSSYLTSRFCTNGGDRTYIIFGLLLSWYVFAFFVIGGQYAHYYRLTWAFFFGHLFAVWRNIRLSHLLAMASVFAMTIVRESPFMMLSFFLALMAIWGCVMLNRKYVMKSNILLFLGGVSYFFYLAHLRLVWTLCYTLRIYDMIFWLIVTIMISYILLSSYNWFQRTLNNLKFETSYNGENIK